MDSGGSDEESVGDLNKLGPRVMINKCEFIPHPSYSDYSDSDDDEPVSTPLPAKRKRSANVNKSHIQWSNEAVKLLLSEYVQQEL